MILIIGDLHLKDEMSYADYISDRRIPERKEILDFIVEQSNDCDKIVMLGDQLNSRTNSPHTIKMFVNFIERFTGKQVFIVAGNHEKFGDGRSAIDFLAEVANKNWHIITNDTFAWDDKNDKVFDLVFCPYFTKSELGMNNNKDATKLIMEKIGSGKILFHHHTMSGTMMANGMDVNKFPESILPTEELKKKFELVVGGHIHNPQKKDNIIVAGSIFNNEVGEIQKYIWKIDESTLKVEQIKLPGRAITKLQDPLDKEQELDELIATKPNSIVKVIITKKIEDDKMVYLKKKLSFFDAFILLEQVPNERKKMHYGEGESLLEFDTEKLLEVYAKEKSVDISKLKHGYELIKL